MRDLHERIDPYDTTSPDFWIKIEHIGRYLLAAQHLKQSKRPPRVADRGCGTGYGVTLMSDYADTIYGYDSSADAITTARRLYPSIPAAQFVQHDIISTPAQHTTDVATAFEVIEHVSSPATLLQHIYQTLTPAGVLFLSVPHCIHESVTPDGTATNPHHLHLFDLPAITELLHTHGFGIQHVYAQRQTYTLMRREVRLARRNHITRSGAIPALHNADALTYRARLIGIPESIQPPYTELDQSYSIIICAIKK